MREIETVFDERNTKNINKKNIFYLFLKNIHEGKDTDTM